MTTKKGQKKDKLRNFLIQLDTSKPREQRIIDIFEKHKQDGIKYKDYILQSIEMREFKQLSVNETSIPQEKQTQAKKQSKTIKDFDKTRINYIKPTKDKITKDDLNF